VPEGNGDVATEELIEKLLPLARLFEQPSDECRNAWYYVRFRWMNDVVGEVVGEIVAERPYQPALGQILGDERRSTERNAAARDRGLDHGRRVIDLQAPVAMDVGIASVLQPGAPRSGCAARSSAGAQTGKNASRSRNVALSPVQ